MENQVPAYETNELGKIRIAPEVVGIIAGLAAQEVEGVAGMSSGFVEELVDRFGRKRNPSRGVQVEVGEREAAVDVSVVVEYGRAIRQVAEDIQRNVKRAIEMMTGLTVVEVNVHVVDISFPKEERPQEAEVVPEKAPRVR
ncbi:Asp23/Gls24 family envelope stress response protein [Hydrogenibacillus schlegelii]|uniref:Alkaline-shock protein n=1 Tax=Hydrogenibacillus schlegelii TaxID=1484 RepID=A0A132MH80_HYDSH|nr:MULTISPECIES: Asp23/Gls24 family envelope stress response protein [Hydrogenibacillus]KWW97125.1 alkaline-shock protein [Hydrogenibacillus schlegelii]MBE3562366.1 Asp23/Gls24 family envelope stress response protein [Hydrogenibacillus schlegelii]OAR03847.1 alkaline-shock protein [Hydrogenibacillus schlegelii]PTQ54731.1 MAG: Alkaline shock protein [Hydrogenibacillus schlegelii]QZA33989.1 Asp23/Gls24 family envelope stress response protein [Hydrogenibacillus sp. N12]